MHLRDTHLSNADDLIVFGDLYDAEIRHKTNVHSSHMAQVESKVMLPAGNMGSEMAG